MSTWLHARVEVWVGCAQHRMCIGGKVHPCATGAVPLGRGTAAFSLESLLKGLDWSELQVGASARCRIQLYAR